MIYVAKNIRKQIGNFSLAIENCQLQKGNIYALTGPNGCGKSTFLNLLSLLDTPTEGKLIFKDKPVNYADKEMLTLQRRKIGYLLQNPYLFNLTVRENISYGLKIRGLPGGLIREKVNRILDIFSLTQLSRRKPSQLSGGEAQRVALARTLVLDADVFLLDEPTANVDKNNIHAVEKLILSINKEQKAAIILTTHSQEQAYRLTKNIISIINGKIKDIAYENVFTGDLKEDEHRLKYVKLSDNVKIQLSEGAPGTVTLAIDPQDIILSKERLDSSALNSFYGTIEKLENANGSLRVFIDTGVSFCALITHRSFQNMELNIGKKVWVTFKANSIKVV